MLNLQHTFIIVLYFKLCTSVLLSIFLSIAVLSPNNQNTKQSPSPATMMYFSVMSLSGMHQDALAFTLQKICGQMRPRPRKQLV